MIKIDSIYPSLPISKVDYAIYDSNGNELDKTLCKNQTIQMSTPIVNKEMINFSNAAELREMGVDIYNKKDKFFNDLCSPYANNSLDISLTDKRNDLYVNVSLCSEGCVYDKIDIDTGKINCNCSEDLAAESFESFGSGLFESTNLALFACYNQVFDLEKCSKNIGFYFSITILVLEFTMNAILVKKGFKSIYQKINSTMVEYYYREVENDWVAFFPKKNEKITPIYQTPYINESKNKENMFTFLFFLTIQQFSIVNLIFYPNEYDNIPIIIINILFALSSDFTMNAAMI